MTKPWNWRGKKLINPYISIVLWFVITKSRDASRSNRGYCLSVFFREPAMVRKAAPINAAITMAITAPPADVDGSAGLGVVVGASVVIGLVEDEVGHGVEDGRIVGVEVGNVAVGVEAARIISDCPE